MRTGRPLVLSKWHGGALLDHERVAGGLKRALESGLVGQLRLGWFPHGPPLVLSFLAKRTRRNSSDLNH